MSMISSDSDSSGTLREKERKRMKLPGRNDQPNPNAPRSASGARRWKNYLKRNKKSDFTETAEPGALGLAPVTGQVRKKEKDRGGEMFKEINKLDKTGLVEVADYYDEMQGWDLQALQEDLDIARRDNPEGVARQKREEEAQKEDEAHPEKWKKRKKKKPSGSSSLRYYERLALQINNNQKKKDDKAARRRPAVKVVVDGITFTGQKNAKKKKIKKDWRGLPVKMELKKELRGKWKNEAKWKKELKKQKAKGEEADDEYEDEEGKPTIEMPGYLHLLDGRAGIAIKSTQKGVYVQSIAEKPGQPDLLPKDYIIAINGESLVKKRPQEQHRIYKLALQGHGLEDVAIVVKRLAPLPQWW